MHDALLRSLERHLRDRDRVLFVEPNLNGWAMGESLGAPDILSIKKTYAKSDFHVYEVKATQSDLLADLRASKWEKYLPLCDRLTFAIEDGIDYQKHLWPLKVGIMVHKGGRWHTKRAASRHGMRAPLAENLALALIFGRMSDGIRDLDGPRLTRLEREREVLLSEELSILSTSANRTLKKKVAEVFDKMVEISRREEKLERATQDLQKEAEIRALRKIEELLGTVTWASDEKSIVMNHLSNVVADSARAMRQKISERLEAAVHEKNKRERK